MNQKIRARISGTGSFTPPRRMTNADFEKLVDTSDEWIVSRTGIRERRIAGDGITGSDMAVEACKRALDMAGCPNEEVDLLVLATVTPDYRLPSNACVVQEKMGLPNAAAFDVVSACSGFINGLSIAKAYIETGQYRKILVVGTEYLSSIANYADRSTCVLFGDAAGAVLVEATTEDAGIRSTFLKSDGSMREWLWIKVGGTKYPYQKGTDPQGLDKIYMSGSDIFKVAVREMGRASQAVIENAGIAPEQIRWVVPHQANLRIIEALVKRLNVPMDRVYLNIEKYGNTSSASVPLALDEANRQGLIARGDHVLMVAFGGGLFWGSALVKW
ncbi:3-oxoacyl-ACP synthase [candidate division GN15 bacterium]|uniref:Beta-ketoacyl-[acyl-carrier-protein] synthase III n=1 Tax=candidate division GN15 bacterium TaxID=2072418 RepID=A0A855X461_9BACT|nr:MAG: 3-oxoacyl-ACP synthase [candidate division GN15 bacterium]